MTTEWTYRGIVVQKPPEGAVGMVYIISHITDTCKVYVGKKILESSRRKRIGVREKAATKTRKTYKVEKKDSGWREYWGSSKSLLEARKTGQGRWTREIVEWCYNKKQMSYYEHLWQFKLNVLVEDSYNDNIGSHWYRRDLINPKKEI